MFKAGAGIVYDSVPENEYTETLNKTMALKGGIVMILIIDNYDSFTYNLYQYVGELYKDVKVLRNDKFTIEELKKTSVERHYYFPRTRQTRKCRLKY